MNKYDLEEISVKLIENITDLLDHFNLEYEDSDTRIMMCCPIHDGDNHNGFSIYKKDVGNWKCFTQQCHEKYGTSNGASIIQLVQALLNTNFYTAAKWCANFVGVEETTIDSDDDINKTDFIHLCKYLNRKRQDVQTFTPRHLIKNFLQIPAEYYISRGYTEDILYKFDVGYCFNQNKPFFDRIITPFYDDNGKYMIACSGRSKYEKCTLCNMYHAPDTRCPITAEEKKRSMKWKHTFNFSADSYLYNYWNAKKYIQESYTAILVEGPGDVWRLEEAGIYNSLGLLGARLSDNQRLILEESGAINIIIATDNDEAGNKAAQSITNSCSKFFNIKRVKYPVKDPGSLTIEQTKQIFIPILERI